MSQSLSRTNQSHEHSVKRVFHPMAHPNEMDAVPPRVISRGEGVYIFDDAGRKTVDAGAGLWNVNLGYSNQAIKDAIAAQLEELPYYSAFKGSTNERLVELSHELAEWLEPENIKRFFFTSGGSDSVETALRLARQFWKLQGKADRIKFLSLKRGYHGTHFGGASVNGNSTFRRAYEPLLPGCFHVAVPFDYRNVFGVSEPERLTDLCLAALEDEIQFQGADTIAAFIAEPVLGAGGVIVPPPHYWPRLKALLDRHGILLIADEVITGFGRTGSWFGCRGWGVQPDLMCLAKALTCGYFPLGAVAIGERVERAFKADNTAMGTISHGYTYSGHPVGCAAALACLRETAALNVVVNARTEGDYLLGALTKLADRFETIGNVRGKGLMMAIEVVSDRAAKTPAGKHYMAAIGQAAYEAGASIRVVGPNIILSPALVIRRHECDEIVAAIEAAFAGVADDPAH